MINEIDLKDFKDIDCTKAREALYNQSDYDLYTTLREFIDDVEKIQRKLTKPVAALLRANHE